MSSHAANTTPYITVLIPLYNGVEFLHESLNSILSQQGVNDVQILVHIGINGHPIHSKIWHEVNTCINRQSVPENIRIIVSDYGTEVRGKSATLNTMVGRSNGGSNSSPWIAILDVDDIWLAGKLAAQIPVLRGGEYGVVGTQCIYFGLGTGSRSGPPLPVGNICEVHSFFASNPIINSSAIIHRSLAQWDSNEDGLEDYDLWLHLWKRRIKFYNCSGKWVMHRLHSGSAFNAKGNHLRVEALIAKHRGHKK